MDIFHKECVIAWKDTTNGKGYRMRLVPSHVFYIGRTSMLEVSFHSKKKKKAVKFAINTEWIGDIEPVIQDDAKVLSIAKPVEPTSSMYCEHANEMPHTCPCDYNCYCKYNSCKSPSRNAKYPPIKGA